MKSNSIWLLGIVAIVAIFGLTTLASETATAPVFTETVGQAYFSPQLQVQDRVSQIPITKSPVQDPVVDRLYLWTEGNDLVAQFFDDQNNPIGSEFGITGATHMNIDSAVCPDGSSMIAWLQRTNDGYYLPYAQFFDRYGRQMGAEFTLNGVPTSEIYVDCGTNNKVVTWLEGTTLMTQFFDKDGAFYTAEFAIDGAVSQPKLSVGRDGQATFAWIQEGTGKPVAQVFDYRGVFEVGDFDLNGIPAQAISVSSR